MEKLPNFSVIMPTYNRRHCIKDAVDSLLAQTYQNFELIITDDASTDGTEEYILKNFQKEIKEGRIRYFVLKKNGGPSVARNEGLKMAKNEWIGYLDTDNKMRSDFLETYEKSIRENKENEIFYAQIQLTSTKNIIGQEFNFKKLLLGNYIDVGVLVHSKKIYSELGGFDVNIKGVEDWDLIIKYTEKYPPKFIEKVVLDYYDGSEFERISPSSNYYGNFKKAILNHYMRLSEQEFFEKHVNKNNGLVLKDQEIQQKNKEIQQKDQEIQQKNQEINMMKSSKFWILRDRYVKLKGIKMQYISDLFKKGLFILKRDGMLVFTRYAYKYLIHGRKYFQSKIAPSSQDYYMWIEKNEKFDVKRIKNEINEFKHKPKISIITPVYNVDPRWLDKCIESAQNQFYENWELCLYDDASTKKETIDCLKKWENKDHRIKISYGKENKHISGASNEALKLATGEFVALLDNDDELSPDALYENIKILNNHSNADFIYSDEDKIEEDGFRLDAYFKPDWSLPMFLSMNYTCHLSVYRKSIIDKIGGFRKGYEGSQDYDLALRFIEIIDKENIFHISKILYHWRKIAGSTAQRTDSKNYAYEAAKNAISDYAKRNKIKGTVNNGIFLGSYRLKRELISYPLVSIIIPTKDKVSYLKRCVLSVLNKNDYPNFEIIILETGSKESETHEFYKEIKNNKKIKILDYFKQEFNFAEANTWVTQYTKGEYLLFLNNDTEVINPEWLSAMMEYAQLEKVGIVGAKLLFPNNTIQHMGIVIGLRNGASHAGVLFPEWQLMSFPFLHGKDVCRNVSAVTGACLLIEKEIFNKVDGFDKIFRIAFNDTDLCLKVRKLGYDIIYTPYAKLIHYESISFGRPYDNLLRSTELFEKERDIFNKKWQTSRFEDPFYNRNLTLKDESLSLKL